MRADVRDPGPDDLKVPSCSKGLMRTHLASELGKKQDYIAIEEGLTAISTHHEAGTQVSLLYSGPTSPLFLSS